MTTTEAKIREAYGELATRPQEFIRLAKLRPMLGDAARADVDETLFAMTRTGMVHLSPIHNRRAMTDEDRAAAVRICGEDNHLIAIEG